jgi:hypothetical protein
LKHRLLTGGNSPQEDNPLDSLILSQYERVEESTFNKDNCPEFDDECRNEDMIHGGYGLEELKEGLLDIFLSININQNCTMILTIGIYLEAKSGGHTNRMRF